MEDNTGLGGVHALSVVVVVMVDVPVVDHVVELLRVCVMDVLVDDSPKVTVMRLVVTVRVGGNTSVVVVPVTVVPEHSGQSTHVAQVQRVGQPRYSMAL
mmetsp:Transcript_38958/g.90197  ORF Transcript_38958/g.90197 Transcript_38958/m.90197 type:complete len:99 (+) Transcript_38958:872-1168(+)